jgi:hypothetical protein
MLASSRFSINCVSESALDIHSLDHIRSAPSSSPFPFLLHTLTLPLPFWFFSFVCKCSLTRSVILASPLCIRPSTSVLCRSYPPWSLLLFAGCVFALNKSFLLLNLLSYVIYEMKVSQV